jgi:hypothetical protein
MEEEPADHYVYGPRDKIKHSIHGRVGTIPARLTGYGEIWDGDECTLYCEGIVQQSTVFGEDLHLLRRIEAKVGSNVVLLHDRVVNHGFYTTPHMYCYHINVGHPLIDEGSRYLAPIADVVWAAHTGEAYRRQGVGYRTMPSPRLAFHEQVWQHEMSADAQGLVPVAVVNDRLGLGFLVETKKAEFPCTFEWQNLQAGQYALGIEPSTNHVKGKAFAKDREELIRLGHGESKCYTTRLEILDGAAEIRAAEDRIHKICAQPDDDYPEPSGQFVPITGRGD